MKRWTVKSLGEVTTCLDSQRIPVKEDDRQKRVGTVPYYGANGQVGWIDEAIFNEPLLLVAEDGGHFDRPERGVAYTIRGPSWINNHAHALRPDESQVLLDFLGYRFRHFDFQPYITGTTRAKLTQRDLMRVEIPVPPLAEQKRIEKLLDEADELRKLRSQADHRTTTFVPALFHEMFRDPVTNPMDWPVHKLPAVCAGKDGIKAGPFGSSLKKDCYTTQGPRVYGQEQVIAGDFTVGDYHVSEEKFEEMTAYAVAVGDVLISLVGTIGKVAIVPDAIERGIINPRLLRVRPRREMLHPVYLAHVLTSPSVARLFGSVATGITMGVLNAGLLKQLNIPLPPLPLQEQFAQRVTEIRELEVAQAASRVRLDALFQSTLHRAFAGEL